MNPAYALAYFEAIRSCSYIVDADLRDAMMRELMYINRALHPGGKGNSKPSLTEPTHTDGAIAKGRRAIAN
jgi:hypothetical protein